MDKRSLVKVFLHDRGDDMESAWCQPVGPSLFRLVNVPFLHAKPTYGDVIAAERNDDGGWEWDRRGEARVSERLHEDGGRYALIIDYTKWAEADFGALLQALEKRHDIVGEGCFGPRGERPGRLYLAAPRALDPAAVLQAVVTLGRGFRFELIHPVPPKKKAAAKKPAKKPTRQKATKKSAATKPVKKPATKKSAKKPATKKSAKKPAKKPATKKPATKKRAKKRAKKPGTRR